jgi:hypothetical protein
MPLQKSRREIWRMRKHSTLRQPRTFTPSTMPAD